MWARVGRVAVTSAQIQPRAASLAPVPCARAATCVPGNAHFSSSSRRPARHTSALAMASCCVAAGAACTGTVLACQRAGVNSASSAISTPCSLQRMLRGLCTAVTGGAEEDDPVWADVMQTVQKEPVFMFSKTTCGYCANAKRLLSKHTGNVVVLELDQLDPTDMQHMQSRLMSLTGQRTVPQIFVGGQHVGGHDALVKLMREDIGAFRARLGAAGATLSDPDA